MTHYTTCRTCQQMMQVTDRLAPPVHPGCEPRYSFLEKTLHRFLDAAKDGDEPEADRLEQLVADAEPRRDLAASALWYATQYEWPVFPLVPGEKRPLTSHGFKDATCDPDQIRRWWADTPTANIGLPTGHAFDVIDVDVPAGTFHWLDLQASDICPDVHGWVSTASGGIHAYIEPTGGGNLAGSIAAGIDYRGRGGFVVAPPSRRADGRAWSWTTPPSPALVGATTGQVAA